MQHSTTPAQVIRARFVAAYLAALAAVAAAGLTHGHAAEDPPRPAAEIVTAAEDAAPPA